VKVRAFACFPVSVVLLLSALSGPVPAGSTNTVYVYGGSFNQRIPADPTATRGWMQDAIVTVPDHVIICDVDVFVSIRHTAAFDLQLFLAGPSGERVTLNESDPFEGYYEGADYIATTFDDEANGTIADARPPFAGSFRPREPLSVFDGQDASGDWKLQVCDAYYVNTGCLDFFSLILTVSVAEQPIAVPGPSAVGLVLLGLALAARLTARSGRASAPVHDR
jgi:subtilisin-like proprotein convertase family protein